jgi:hypothetical protein
MWRMAKRLGNTEFEINCTFSVVVLIVADVVIVVTVEKYLEANVKFKTIRIKLNYFCEIFSLKNNYSFFGRQHEFSLNLFLSHYV